MEPNGHQIGENVRIMEQNFRTCVLHMIPSSIDENHSKQLIQDLYYSIKTSSKDSVSKVLEYYRKLLIRNSNDIESWKHLEMFAGIMCQLSSPEEKEKYLMQCLSLIDKSYQSDEREGVFLRPDIMSSQRKSNGSVYAESFENFEKISDRRSIMSYGGNVWQATSSDTTLKSLSDPYFSTMVPKTDIIQSIPYLLLGTPSTLFELKDKTYYIPSNIPNGESQQLHNIIEAGLLYLNLRIKVELLKKSIISGTLKVSFLTFIESRLREYNLFVNKFSSHLHPNDPLCFVYQHICPEILKLRTCLSYVELLDKLRGEQLLTIFQSQKRNGDPILEKFSSDAFAYLSQSYFEKLCNWVLSGRLDADNSDFFVQNTKSTEELDFTFIREKIPTFIPSSCARKIYIIGKSLRFLEIYCNELEWVGNLSNKYAVQYQLLDLSTIDQRFIDIINQQYEEINVRVNEVLKSKFYYFETIELLKDILLMGKSDFIYAIIQSSKSLFNQPSQLLESHYLTRCLQVAVQQSSMRNRLNKSDHNTLINRLDARLLELAHGSSGWDVFTLDYLIDQPLSSVININQHGSRREYLRIFNFLWRIKRNGYLYEQEWQRNSSLMKLFRKLNSRLPFLKDLLNKMSMINVLKNQIQSFTKKIETYCFENIIDKEYSQLITNLHQKESDNIKSMKVKVLKNGVKVSSGILKPDLRYLKSLKEITADDMNDISSYDIEDLQRIHSTFLANILQHPLLYSGTGAAIGTYTNQLYPTSLVLLMDMSYDYIRNYSELNNILHEICIQLNLDPNQHLYDSIGRFNTVSKKLIEQWKDFENECNAYIKDLKSDQSTELNKLSRVLH